RPRTRPPSRRSRTRTGSRSSGRRGRCRRTSAPHAPPPEPHGWDDRPVKLGMNMLLWSTDVSASSYDAIFERLKKIGFDGVEIPIFDREVDKYAKLGGRLDDLGLERLAVAARGEADNPVTADAAGPADAIAAMKSNLDSAAALGAPLICGPLGAPLGVFTGAAPTAEEKARAVAYLREVAPYAEERGVTI